MSQTKTGKAASAEERTEAEVASGERGSKEEVKKILRQWDE